MNAAKKFRASAPPGWLGQARKLSHWPTVVQWPASDWARICAPCGYLEEAPEGHPRRFAVHADDVSCQHCRDYARSVGGEARILMERPGGGMVDLSRFVR